ELDEPFRFLQRRWSPGFSRSSDRRPAEPGTPTKTVFGRDFDPPSALQKQTRDPSLPSEEGGRPTGGLRHEAARSAGGVHLDVEAAARLGVVGAGRDAQVELAVSRPRALEARADDEGLAGFADTAHQGPAAAGPCEGPAAAGREAAP